MTVRIMLVDDHPFILEGLRTVLENQPAFEIVGEATDGARGVELARRLRPDLIVIDISMPGMNGIEAIHRIRADLNGVRVIVLSMYSSREFVEAALRSGAAGYILKEQPVDMLIDAIHTVMSGKTYICPGATPALTGDRSIEPAAVARKAVIPLTRREKEVLSLIADGCSTKQIAARLHVSFKTISTHRQNIMRKLDIHNSAGLTRYAIESGLAGLPARSQSL